MYRISPLFTFASGRIADAFLFVLIKLSTIFMYVCMYALYMLSAFHSQTPHPPSPIPVIDLYMNMTNIYMIHAMSTYEKSCYICEEKKKRRKKYPRYTLAYIFFNDILSFFLLLVPISVRSLFTYSFFSLFHSSINHPLSSSLLTLPMCFDHCQKFIDLFRLS